MTESFPVPLSLTRAVSPIYRSITPNSDEIRLLILQPAQIDDKVEIQIVYEHLKNKPVYEALSYVWGDPKRTTAISLIPNLDESDRLETIDWPVTTNLESALRHLRYADKPRTLWADALSINQRNDDEKTHQVISPTPRVYMSVNH